MSSINDTSGVFTRSNICFEPIRANHGTPKIAGNITACALCHSGCSGEDVSSERILSDASMDYLGLSTIGKKDKFATAVQDLFGKFIKVTIMIIQSVFIFVVSSSSE